MTLDGVVVCSGGLQVVRRGASPPAQGPVLRVVGTQVIRPPDLPPVEARTANDVVWRQHWLEDGRLVIEFVNVAFVEVDEGSSSVAFDRALPAEMEEHLLLDHVLPLVLARRGGLVLHGAVISREGRGAVVIGGSGMGKSTLTAFAWQRGWTVGGDDGAVLCATDPPMVEPTYSTVRLTPTSAELLGIDAEATSPVAGKMRISDGRSFRQEPVELRVIAGIRPVAAGEPSRFQPLSGVDAHAFLFGSTFHADLGTRLLPGTIGNLASIVETATVGWLTVPRGLAGLAAAEALLSAYVDREGGVDRKVSPSPRADGPRDRGDS